MFDNPDDLIVEQFVEHEFRLYSAPPHNDSIQNYETSKTFVEIDGVQALRIEKGITFDQPDIFIPHEKQVIRIYVSGVRPTGAPSPPCRQTLELLNGILDSIDLFIP